MWIVAHFPVATPYDTDAHTSRGRFYVYSDSVKAVNYVRAVSLYPAVKIRVKVDRMPEAVGFWLVFAFTCYPVALGNYRALSTLALPTAAKWPWLPKRCKFTETLLTERSRRSIAVKPL